MRAAAAFASILGLAVQANAQSPTFLVPDVTATLGTAAPVPTLDDDDAATDDAAGTVAPVLLTMLGAAVPAEAEIAGLELSTTAPAVLALDVTAALPGLPPGSAASPQDVASWDPNTDTYSISFDGALAGVPENARIDAVSRTPGGALLLSFDITVELPLVGDVDDEDLVEVVPGGFQMAFDGSAFDVPEELDLDAASRPDAVSADLLLSFDGTGEIAGVPFDDEDTLLFSAGTWALYSDASLSDPAGYADVDTVALPEPGASVSLVIGAALLAALSRRARPR
jgi:hypothetical protein